MNSKLKLLIVDDSPLVAPRIKSLLDNLLDDITIGEAANAEEALDVMAEVVPDAVLLDLNMEGKGGVELLSDIKSKYPEVKVIVFTNHGDAYYRKICQDGGADYFFDKTTEFEMLPKTMQQLVEAAFAIG